MQMINPLSFVSCVLLLDCLAVVSTDPQYFSGLASALRINMAVQCSPSPQEILAWKCTASISVTQTAVLGLCSVITYVRT